MANSTFSVTTPNGVVQTGDTVVARIQNRRGYKINLPQPLAPGELGWCIDTKELFIGLDASTSSTSITISNQIEAQRLLDDELIEFSSKWGYLNGTVSGSVDNDGTTLSEEEFIRGYLSLSTEDILNGSSVASDAESNIFTLSQLNNAVLSSIPSALQPNSLRVTTTESSSARNAVVQVSISGNSLSLDDSFPDQLVESDAGLGYFQGDTVFIANPNGTAANFVVDVSDDGQGKVEKFNTGTTTGSNWDMPDGTYKMQVSGPDLNSKIATSDPSSIVIVDGKLQEIDVLSQGGEYKTRPVVEVRGGGAVVDAVVKSIWDRNSGTVVGFEVINQGSGYTSAPTVIVRPPVSKTLYKFRYDIGIPNSTSSTIASTNSTLNLQNDILYPNSRLLSELPNEQSQVLGVSGQGKTVTLDASGENILTMDTSQQSSAVTTLLNALNSSSDSIAQSSQNVEILTEFSTLPTPPPSVIIDVEDLESANLAPTSPNGWTTVSLDNKLNPGSTIPMTFDPSVSNSIFLKYSCKHTGSESFLRNGFMNIVSFNSDADLTTTSTEVKESPSLDGLNLYFRSIVQSGQAVVQYWHTLPSNIEFKFSTTEWLS